MALSTRLSFNEGVQNNPSILATEQGRNEASFLANKADRIIQDRTASFDENGPAWYHQRVQELTQRAGFGLDQGPPPPPGMYKSIHFQAGEDMSTKRAEIADRVTRTLDRMFSREPGENYIRGYNDSTQAEPKQQQPTIDQSPPSEPQQELRSIFDQAAESSPKPITEHFNERGRQL